MKNYIIALLVVINGVAGVAIFQQRESCATMELKIGALERSLRERDTAVEKITKKLDVLVTDIESAFTQVAQEFGNLRGDIEKLKNNY